MASHAPITGAPSRATTTRRQFCTGAALATLAGAMPAAVTANAPPANSPALAALFAEMARLDAESDRIHYRQYLPAKARYEAAINAIPHVSFSGVPNIYGAALDWSTSNNAQVVTAQAIVTSTAANKRDPHIGECRKLVAAAKRRERAKQLARRSCGLEAACKASDAVGAEIGEVCARIETFPAVSLADLEAKLAFIVEREMAVEETAETILADVRRIIGGRA